MPSGWRSSHPHDLRKLLDSAARLEGVEAILRLWKPTHLYLLNLYEMEIQEEEGGGRQFCNQTPVYHGHRYFSEGHRFPQVQAEAQKPRYLE